MRIPVRVAKLPALVNVGAKNSKIAFLFLNEDLRVGSK